MDIQQKDKESLAAYIHRFKREAKRCIFTNNAATIRIFAKGLKKTHILVACVYQKGPQSLSDIITEVEKLQAAQQLTATLLPSPMVNVMSNEEDQCFQCPKLGHIAHHCPNVHCFECKEYGHIAPDCPDRIPPSGMPACHKGQNSNTRHHPRSTSRYHHSAGFEEVLELSWGRVSHVKVYTMLIFGFSSLCMLRQYKRNRYVT